MSLNPRSVTIMDSAVDISIIIPAYKEEKRIEKILNTLTNNFDEESEIIVVCNGPVDKTLEIIKSYEKKHSNIKHLELSGKAGKGRAIIEGFNATKGRYIGFLDADDSFSIKHIKEMIAELHEKKYDAIIASKWKNQEFTKVPEKLLRKIMSRGWNSIVKTFLYIDFDDTQAGAKFLSKNAWDSINQDFICRGFSFDVELLLKIKQQNLKIKEVYVPSKNMGESTFGYKYIVPMFIDLIKLWRKSS